MDDDSAISHMPMMRNEIKKRCRNPWNESTSGRKKEKRKVVRIEIDTKLNKINICLYIICLYNYTYIHYTYYLYT